MEFKNTSRINKELKFLNRIEGVIGSALVEYNGILIASNLPRDYNERDMLAMSATMFGATENAVANIGESKIFRMIVDLEDESWLVINAQKYLFLVMIKSTANMGLILIEVEEIIKKLESLKKGNKDVN
ncbi:MAG: roadblock/LC7 domain-containing protein [Promethearchaeia archaeon]